MILMMAPAGGLARLLDFDLQHLAPRQVPQH
jgi:hypothetical protein